MKLSTVRAKRYRSLLDADIAIGGTNLFIGANASGKSTINPFLLRRDWNSIESPRLDHYGRNLAETLYRIDAGDCLAGCET